MEKIELKIPNLGEAESTEIIEVNVKKGDEVNINDPLVVLESEKAAMEVPSDFTGVISDVYVKEGDSVNEGMAFASITVEESVADVNKAEGGNENKDSNEEKYEERKEEPSIDFSGYKGINAGPAVRKYARELEIDLNKITPSGRNNKITKEDLKLFIHSNKQSAPQYQVFSEDDLRGFGEYKIEKQSKLRVLGARNLHKSWISIPHVTHFDEINLSKILKLRENVKASVLSYIVHFIAKALHEFPIFNSSLIGSDKIMIKNYVNIGVAVDTEMGLVVPVVKDADKISVEKIDSDIAELADKARNKKLKKDEIEGATFSVSSLGKFGGIGFTPIINPPEVAILSVSNFQKKLVLLNGQVEEHTFVPLALSYDHRVINGGDAGRFMVYLKHIIET